MEMLTFSLKTREYSCMIFNVAFDVKQTHIDYQVGYIEIYPVIGQF